ARAGPGPLRSLCAYLAGGADAAVPGRDRAGGHRPVCPVRVRHPRCPATARIAIDHWHLVRLANDVVTEVRQRITRQLHQRRGLASDPVSITPHPIPTTGPVL